VAGTVGGGREADGPPGPPLARGDRVSVPEVTVRLDHAANRQAESLFRRGCTRTSPIELLTSGWP
jgi:hypothetical protein